jgi:cell division protein ZapA (FtsZ GTPase activity inhibitor)
MKELSIKVAIGGRFYPLTIKADEEESVRKAAKAIEEKIRDFEVNYSVKDKQDLLAMCALQLATEAVTSEGKVVVEAGGVEQQLDITAALLEDYLQKSLIRS